MKQLSILRLQNIHIFLNVLVPLWIIGPFRVFWQYRIYLKDKKRPII